MLALWYKTWLPASFSVVMGKTVLFRKDIGFYLFNKYLLRAYSVLHTKLGNRNPG